MTSRFRAIGDRDGRTLIICIQRGIHSGARVLRLFRRHPASRPVPYDDTAKPTSNGIHGMNRMPDVLTHIS